MKKALILGIALTLVCGTGLSISTAQENAQDNQVPEAVQENQGPEVIKITDGTDKSMFPAYFPHRDHQNRLKDFEYKVPNTETVRKGCAICHHGKSADNKQVEYAEAEQPKSRKCNTCHNKNADGINLEGKISGVPLPLTSPIQRAGHGRCAGCHKDQKSTAKPPLNLMMCTTCHNTYKDKEDKVEDKAKDMEKDK